MKVRLLLIVLFQVVTFQKVFSQDLKENFINNNNEKDTTFKEAFLKDKFKFTQINYPPKAIETGACGKVYVSFIVDEKGNIDSIEVKNPLGSGLDEEAMRIISQTNGMWEPAKQDGKAIRSKKVMPITFQMSELNEPRVQKAEKYFELGVEEFKKGNFDLAKKQFKKCIKNKPWDHKAYLNLGSSEINLGEINNGCKSYAKAKELGSPDVDSFIEKFCSK